MLADNLDVKLLLMEGIGEVTLYFIKVGIILFGAWLVNKIKNYSRFIIAFGIVLFVLLDLWNKSIKSEMFISILFSVILCAELYLLKILPYTYWDYFFMVLIFMFPRRFFNSSITVFGNCIIFFIIMLALFALTKLRTGKTKGYLLCCYTGFIYLSLTSYFYLSLSEGVYGLFRGVLNSNVLLFVLMEFGVLILILGITYFISKKMANRIVWLKDIGRRYAKVEKDSMFLAIVTIILFFIINFIFVVSGMWNSQTNVILPVLCIFILIMQLSFVMMILRVMYYKETIGYMQLQNESITNYNVKLQENLSAMEGIRHDIKNVFFTMGNYVENSENEEMKQFFWKEIFPFGDKEIENNYLFSRLYLIPDEQLRAFLHLKIVQGLNHNITVHLEVQTDIETFFLGMDIIDLTRVIGIFCDNAMEECITINNKKMDIIVRSNRKEISYIIKNPVSEKTMAAGITSGKSTKQGHAGVGLSNVKQILERYPLASLNSYMQEYSYTQSLNIYKSPE